MRSQAISFTFDGRPLRGAEGDTLATGAPHAINAPFSLDRFTRGETIDEAGAGPQPQHR